MLTLGFALFDTTNLVRAIETGDLNGRLDLSTNEAGLSMVVQGGFGAAVLGIVVITSEYSAQAREIGGGMQLFSSLAAVSQRWMIFTSKALVLGVTVSLLAAITVPLVLISSQVMLGEHGEVSVSAVTDLGWRFWGAVGNWTFTALLAMSLATFFQNALVPILLVGVSVGAVSFGGVATLTFDGAWLLPDVASVLMFADYSFLYPGAEPTISPGEAAWVMVGWVFLLLLAALLRFTRNPMPRDR
ncbi:hypothetical protein AUL38_14065 [Leucobacter sp. G161]|nr:hypothetical protein AUL38_14065 [Leucobacter sp. G161]